MDAQIKTENNAKKWIILLNVCVSVFMATLDGSIVNIALPVISRELSVDISQIQWVVTSYLLTISALLLIWGKISDMYGRKKVYAFGFIIFTIGSALCGLSGSLSMLIAARVLQAMGASSMMALSQGIVTSVFPPQERGKGLGILGTTVAMGSLVGPSLGGILVHTMGWQSIFWINLPIGILGTVLTFIVIPEINGQKNTGMFDYKGAAIFVSALLLLFLGLLLNQEGAIPGNLLLPMVAAAAILLIIFIRTERKIEDPLINLNLFRSWIFSMGIGAAFLSFIALFSTTLFMPFYLQNVLKLDTLKAGIIMSFYPICTALVAPFSGWLSDKITYRPLTVLGLSINAAGLIGLSYLQTTSSMAHIIFLMSMLGVGVAIFQSPNNSSIMGAVPRDQLGVAGGINALFRNLGMVSGITLSVLLFTSVTKMDFNNIAGNAGELDPQLFLKGFRVVLLVSAFVCILALGISLTRAVGIKTKKSA